MSQEHPAGATFPAQTGPAAAQWAGWMDPAVELKFRPAQAVVGSFSMHETLTAVQEHPAGASFPAQAWPAAAQWAGGMTPAVELKFQQAQAVVGSFSIRKTLTAAQEHPAGASFPAQTWPAAAHYSPLKPIL